MTERERFLREFERRLGLRGKRRADALAEIESHMEEAVEAGEDEAEVVARLGQPKEIARALNRAEASRYILVVAASLVFAVAATVAASQAGTGDNPEPALPALVSASTGKVKGVGIGDSHGEIERVFGPDLGGGGAPAGANRFTGPQAIIPPGVYAGVLRYHAYLFLISDDGVYGLMTTAEGAETERGVGVGNSLADVREAYPEALCGAYDYGESGYPWCRTRIGGNSVFFGADPVESITVLQAAAVCRPSGYPELGEEACRP